MARAGWLCLWSFGKRAWIPFRGAHLAAWANLRKHGKHSKAMIDEDEVRKSLLAKREQLTQRIGGTQASEREEVAERQDDNAQLWEVSDVRDDLDTQAATELDQVNEALARLDAGEYGLCMDCGEPIAEARLKALPYATLCIQCAEKAEQSP